MVQWADAEGLRTALLSKATVHEIVNGHCEAKLQSQYRYNPLQVVLIKCPCSGLVLRRFLLTWTRAWTFSTALGCLHNSRRAFCLIPRPAHPALLNSLLFKVSTDWSTVKNANRCQKQINTTTGQTFDDCVKKTHTHTQYDYNIMKAL